MNRVTWASLVALASISIFIAYSNCSKPDGVVSAASTSSPTTTLIPIGGVTTTYSSSSTLQFNEDFESWYGSPTPCSNPSNLSDCPAVEGPGNNKAIATYAFSSACESGLPVWIGGGISFHGVPAANGNPPGSWAAIRFHGSFNQAIVSKDIQKQASGFASVNFNAESPSGTTQVFLSTHGSYSAIASCTGTYSSTVNFSQYFWAYNGTGWPGGYGPGFAFGRYAGGAVSILAYIPYTLPTANGGGDNRHWHQLRIARDTNGYTLSAMILNSTGWSNVSGSPVTLNFAQLGGSELPLGRVAINADDSGNVAFKNFNVNW